VIKRADALQSFRLLHSKGSHVGSGDNLSLMHLTSEVQILQLKTIKAIDSDSVILDRNGY